MAELAGKIGKFCNSEREKVTRLEVPQVRKGRICDQRAHLPVHVRIDEELPIWYTHDRRSNLSVGNVVRLNGFSMQFTAKSAINWSRNSDCLLSMRSERAGTYGVWIASGKISIRSSTAAPELAPNEASHPFPLHALPGRRAQTRQEERTRVETAGVG